MAGVSLKAKGELALQFGEFRNVDLFYQGLYRLRCRVYPEVEGATKQNGPRTDLLTPNLVAMAEDPPPIPKSSEGTTTTSPIRRKSKLKQIQAPCVTEQDKTYWSRSILVRFVEEVIDIESLVVFSYEVDLNAPAMDTFVVEVTLLFADVAKHVTGIISDCIDRVSLEIVPLSAFSEVSIQYHRVGPLDRVAEAYCPVIFDEFHFCQVDLVVRNALLDLNIDFASLTSERSQQMAAGEDSRRSISTPAANPSFCARGGCDVNSKNMDVCGIRWDGRSMVYPKVSVLSALEKAMRDLACQVRDKELRPKWRERQYCGHRVGQSGYHTGYRRWCHNRPCNCDGTCGPRTGCQCVECYISTFGEEAPLTILGAYEILRNELTNQLSASLTAVCTFAGQDNLKEVLAGTPKASEERPAAAAAAAAAESPVTKSMEPRDSIGQTASARLSAALRGLTSSSRTGEPLVTPRCGTPADAAARVALAALQLLAEDTHPLSIQLTKAWRQTLWLSLYANSSNTVARLRKVYLEHLQRRWKTTSFSCLLAAAEMSAPCLGEATSEVHGRLAAHSREETPPSAHQPNPATLPEAQPEGTRGSAAVKDATVVATSSKRSASDMSATPSAGWESRGSKEDAEVAGLDPDQGQQRSLHLSQWPTQQRLRSTYVNIEDDDAFVEDLGIWLPFRARPRLFEQRYAEGPAPKKTLEGSTLAEKYKRASCGPSSSSSSSSASNPEAMRNRQAKHVVVLVHGFQGQAFDMRLLMNNLKLAFPRVTFICASSNEQDTEIGIDEMAAKLAAEVKSIAKEDRLSARFRLSFVAHSIGGLIVRAALPMLEELKDKMFTYISFSSPHLGYAYSPHVLFRTGFWLLQKVRGAKCLQQVSMTDSEDPLDSYLAHLADLPGLDFFKHVVLVSSFQDSYAPFESSRIECSKLSASDPKFGRAYEWMVETLLQRIRPSSLLRIDFDLLMKETTLDTIIGRAAHIQFIENQLLMRMFIQSYSFLFE